MKPSKKEIEEILENQKFQNQITNYNYLAKIARQKDIYWKIQDLVQSLSIFYKLKRIKR